MAKVRKTRQNVEAGLARASVPFGVRTLSVLNGSIFRSTLVLGGGGGRASATFEFAGTGMWRDLSKQETARPARVRVQPQRTVYELGLQTNTANDNRAHRNNKTTSYRTSITSTAKKNIPAQCLCLVVYLSKGRAYEFEKDE